MTDHPSDSEGSAQIINLFEALKSSLVEGSKQVPPAECHACDAHTVRCGHPDYCCPACPERPTPNPDTAEER